MVRGCLCGHPKKTPGSGGGARLRRVSRSVKRWHFILQRWRRAARHPIGHAGHAQAQILLGPGWPPVRPQWPYDDREQPWRFRCEAFASILVEPRRCSGHVRQPTSMPRPLACRFALHPCPCLCCCCLPRLRPDRHPPPQHGRQSRASQPEPRDADQGRARGHAHDRQHVASEAPSIR